MNTVTFLILLSAFSVLSSLVTEGIKKIASDKANLSYNIVALIVALVIGGIGCGIYYQLNAKITLQKESISANTFILLSLLI